MADRVFSKKCSKCRQRAVFLVAVDYQIPVEHDGRTYDVRISKLWVPKCSHCGNIVLDEEANRQISAAFRKEAGLLSPEQIRGHRLALGYTQQALADLLGVAVSTLSRWETGAQIQQRPFDRFLRSVFLLPELRSTLADDAKLHLPEPRQREAV